MRQNNQIIVIICYLILVGFSLFAKELKTEKTVGKDGEPITTVYYQNESNGIIKKIFYGNAPKYRLLQVFYEKNSKNYFEHADYFNFEIGLPDFPEGKSLNHVLYYRSDNPNFWSKRITQPEKEFITETFLYENGSENNVNLTRIWNYPNGQRYLEEEYYDKGERNLYHLKEFRRMFNEKKEIIFTQGVYYDKPDFIIQQTNQYLPPEFSEKDNKPWKIARTFENEPTGILRIESEFLSGNRSSDNIFYDYKVNPKKYNKVTNLYLNKELIKQVQYYEIPLDGKIYLRILDKNPDGTVTAKGYDLDSKEIK